jgi:hypothetical protein
LLLALVSFSCGGDGTANGPPIDPSTSLSSAGTSADGDASSGTTGDPCVGYLGCVQNACDPGDSSCVSDCEHTAGVDGPTCSGAYCHGLFATCDLDNTEDACTDYAMYCTSDTSSTTAAADSSSSDGSSSTTATESGPCDGYFFCLEECDGDPELCDVCPSFIEGATQRECDALRCEDLFDDCNDGVPGACLEYGDLCGPDGSSSSDSGSGSGSSSATG